MTRVRDGRAAGSGKVLKRCLGAVDRTREAMRYRWNEARVAPLSPEPEPPVVEPEIEDEEAQVQRPALGALLIDAGLVTAEQIRDALAEGLTTGERLGE